MEYSEIVNRQKQLIKEVDSLAKNSRHHRVILKIKRAHSAPMEVQQ